MLSVKIMMLEILYSLVKNSTERFLTKFSLEGSGYSNTINLIFVLVLRFVQFKIHNPTVVEMKSDSDSFPKSETE